MRIIQIAIDGPAGAGKSTIAKKLARLLNIIYIDTGAMYRVVTYTAIESGVSCNDKNKLAQLAQDLHIQFVRKEQDKQLVYCDGIDVTEEIRQPLISHNVSQVALHKEVRFALVKKQQELAKEKDVVMDGRDIGTVVLPQAECKIFLTASLEERSWRRYLELRQKGYQDEYEVVKKEMETRDRIDQSRYNSPLRPAIDAVIVDTTNLTEEEVLENILEICRQKRRDK